MYICIETEREKERERERGRERERERDLCAASGAACHIALRIWSTAQHSTDESRSSGGVAGNTATSNGHVAMCNSCARLLALVSNIISYVINCVGTALRNPLLTSSRTLAKHASNMRNTKCMSSWNKATPGQPKSWAYAAAWRCRCPSIKSRG